MSSGKLVCGRFNSCGLLAVVVDVTVVDAVGLEVDLILFCVGFTGRRLVD